MDRREALLLAGAAPIVVVVSSYLGLAGRFFFIAPVDGFHLMAGIWRLSAVADAVFALGTLVAAYAGYVLARRGAPRLAFGLGAGAHWLTYWASYVALPVHGDTASIAGVDPGSAFVLVATWGFVGLAAAAALPLVIAKLASRAALAADGEDAPHVARSES